MKEIILTYTTTNDRKLRLPRHSYKTHTFENNVGHVTLRIDSDYVEVPDLLFCKCHTLKSVSISDGLHRIGMSAFFECINLESIEIPGSVRHIGDFAFSGCYKLQGISIPDGVAYIGVYAFSGCGNIHSISIPDGVAYIGDYAFSGCVNVDSVTMPENVNRIGKSVFFRCKSLPCNTIDRGIRPIRAYKGFDHVMTCRDFQYECGKSYHTDKVEVCECGFHACLNPFSVLSYYPREEDCRYAVVEMGGDIDFGMLESDSKIAATDIRIVRELTYDELVKEGVRLLRKC